VPDTSISLPPTRARRTRARRRQDGPRADRARRYRQRQRDGVIMVTVPVSPAQTAKLAALRYLTESELENRARIAAAIAALLDGIETT
jgi:hypothetical protein